jgi:hypothetical protein
LGIVGLAVLSITVVAWGSLSAWSWIVAALAYQALSGLRNAAYAPVWQERGAGALIVLVASALIVVIARRAARATQSRGASTGAISMSGTSTGPPPTAL